MQERARFRSCARRMPCAAPRSPRTIATLSSTDAHCPRDASATPHPAELLARWPKDEPLAALVSGGELGAHNGWSIFARPRETVVIPAGASAEEAGSILAGALARTSRTGAPVGTLARTPGAALTRVSRRPTCGASLVRRRVDLRSCVRRADGRRIAAKTRGSRANRSNLRAAITERSRVGAFRALVRAKRRSVCRQCRAHRRVHPRR